MATDLAVKFAVTAAALGCATRKDLARAFAKGNADTSFDLDRSYKWLQGRAQPRDPKLYVEWLGLLGMQKSKDWLVECSSDEFLAEVSEGLGLQTDVLWQQACAFLGEAVVDQASPLGLRRQLEGVFAAYSWAWSPYHAGRLIRGTLKVTQSRKLGRPDAVYSELLQGTMTRMHGTTYDSGQSLFLNLFHESGELPLYFAMFRPTPPTSMMMGHLTGAALMGPNPPPSSTRIIMVRVPVAWAVAERGNRYLNDDEPVVEDLIQLGLRPLNASLLEGEIQKFLRGASGSGVDQVSADLYSRILNLLDPIWLDQQVAPVGTALDI